MIKLILNVAITVLLVLLFLDILFYFNGSLEVNPTEEQNEKIHIAAFLLGLLLIAVESILLFIRIKVKKL
jgi:hypothetical protein